MDSLGSYRSTWWNPRPLSKRELERMKKIMRRVPVLKKKHDEYHETEEKEADSFFSKELNEIS